MFVDNLTIHQRIRQACKDDEGITLSVEDVRALYSVLYKQQWISVKDALPDNGQKVVAVDFIQHCTFEDGDFYAEYYEYDTGHTYSENIDVAYWSEMGDNQ